MDIASINTNYCNNVSSICTQLNDFFTTKGWVSSIKLECAIIYYYYMDKLQKCTIRLENYNKFEITVGKKYVMDYINAQDLIIINNQFSININNMNVIVHIDENYVNEDNILCLNNINVFHYKNIFGSIQNHIKHNIFDQQTREHLEFNSQNVEKMMVYYHTNLYKLSCFKMFETIYKLMEEKKQKDMLVYAPTFITHRYTSIVSKRIDSLGMLLDAANYIDDSEPLAKRR